MISSRLRQIFLTPTRPVIVALNCLLIILPYLFVEFPPAIDLPHHINQLTMFASALSEPSSPYEINWSSPYALSYLLIAPTLLLPPEYSARIAMAAMGILWVVALQGVAARYGRSPWTAMLASIFFFNHITYSGFYPFLFGWPLFLFWIILLYPGDEPYSKLRWLTLYLLAPVLYFTHLYWCVAAAIWLGLNSTFPLRNTVTRLRSEQKPLLFSNFRLLLPRFILITLLLGATLAWYISFQENIGSTENIRYTNVVDRITSHWLADYSLGGIKGSVERIAFYLIMIWVAVGLIRRSDEKPRRELMTGAILFLGLAFFLPDTNSSSVYFASRWAAPGVMLLLLALPAPRLSNSIRIIFSVGVTLLFCVYTSARWYKYEQSELVGLRSALDALPANSRVMGLTYNQSSRLLKGYPNMQLFAYARVYRGGLLNASLGDIGFCFVVYKKDFPRPWRPGYPHNPDLMSRQDIINFDYLLVGGQPEHHLKMSERSYLNAVTNIGDWRLYRIAAGISSKQ